MIDFVYPLGNENKFIKIAEHLKLTGLIFVHVLKKDQNIQNLVKEKYVTNLFITHAIECKPEEVKKYKGKYLTIVRLKDSDNIRHIVEQIKPDIILGAEYQKRDDFIHHRASGLNHIITKIASEKKVLFGVSFSDIINSKNKQIILGRVMQNITFFKKYNISAVFSSFSNHPMYLRSEKDLTSFFKVLGWTQKPGWNR